MSDISNTIENIKKINDDLYKYDIVKTTIIQTNIETLLGEKTVLEARIVNIDYILAEIEKLKI